jgi:hypothetical protein
MWKLTQGLALQVLDSNVRRGSAVFERGHFLVLAMAGSQRDRDVLWQLLTQVRLEKGFFKESCHGAAMCVTGHVHNWICT